MTTQLDLHFQKYLLVLSDRLAQLGVPVNLLPEGLLFVAVPGDHPHALEILRYLDYLRDEGYIVLDAGVNQINVWDGKIEVMYLAFSDPFNPCASWMTPKN